MVILNNSLSMDYAALGFAAIGSEARLLVLQTLVKAGPHGLSVGAVQTRTKIAASTLAHHLRILTSAGLVVQEKKGRSVINRAAYGHLELLAAYILKECCVEGSDSSGDAQ